MSTATAPGTGLDWVTTTDHEHGQPCGVRTHNCPRQATHAGIFQLTGGNCANFRERIPYCLPHRDLLLEKAAATGNRFRCCWPHHLAGSSVPVLFIRMEPLR